MKSIISKRTLVASLLGLTAFGAVFGSAASLGGLNSAGVGAGSAVVASCDSDGVDVSYTKAFDASGPAGYKVTAVTVAGVDNACDGQTVAVTLTDSADDSVGAGTLAIPTGPAVNHTVSVSPSAPVVSVANAHVVIS